MVRQRVSHAMSIPSQLPSIALATRSSALQALALQAGQMLDGKVIGPAPNGGTQVQINGQMLNLVLPNAVNVGAVLNFEVQGSGAQLRLALLLQPPTPQPAPTPQPPVTVSAGARAAIENAPLAQASQSAVSSSPTLAPQSSAPAMVPGSVAPTVTTNAGTTPPPASVYPQAAARAPVVTSTPSGLSVQRPNVAQMAAPERPAGVMTQGTAPPVSQPATPKAALAQMVQVSLPRQDSAAGLTTALSTLAGKVGLPEPVMRAVQRVLAAQVSLEGGKLDGSALQKAVLSSGLFQEAQLARGAVTLAQGDMKASLLVLRQTMASWLGHGTPVAAVANVPPPLKGAVPRARGPAVAPLDPGTTLEDLGRHVQERTEGALARVRLHQHASLPDAQAKGSGDWSLDLPVLVGQHQTMMQFQIHRDQHNGTEAEGERGWQMRFAINLPDLGEVGAQVSLRGQATGIMLWAAEPDASAALESEMDALRETLVSVGLQPGAIVVRHGEPPAPAARPSGNFVDART
ncbi:hypothetical protein WH87_07835 [Devosia epidermidihirudinis]|uniref:Flagellar hook-length control protein-like C-terminal domain-containing protein n=2 Tax=Devosia epidermidihirudinis TaxID=1293439 RepID=A0A0F5QDK0_9HYPH|nr:hypothetical protein WH87_07835 [Devosia epidermidihirudinis]